MASVFGEQRGVGVDSDFEIVFLGMADHIKDAGVQKGFPCQIEIDPVNKSVSRIDDIFVQRHIHKALLSTHAIALKAHLASEVAGIGRFNPEAGRHGTETGVPQFVIE